MSKRISWMAAAAAVLVAGAAFADDPIKTRKDGFEGMKKAMGEVKAILEKGDSVASAGAVAQRMATYAATIPSLFPAGSDKGGDTEARAEIWQTWDDFTAKAKGFETAALKLQEIAAGGDKSATMKQFAAVGGTCKACHDKYRED